MSYEKILLRIFLWVAGSKWWNCRVFLWLLPRSGAQNIFFHMHRDLYGRKNRNWSNSEVTIHPSVTYYCIDGEQHHLSLVILSEKLTHDASSIHLFNTRLVKYLKNKFDSRNLKKLLYFFDGIALQYKNKSNFLNLIYLEKDF